MTMDMTSPVVIPDTQTAAEKAEDAAAAAAAEAAAAAAAAMDQRKKRELAAAAGGGKSSATPTTRGPSLRADIERMTRMLKLGWVKQYMLASTLTTDVGVLTNPAGMQAAVVCHAVDDHQTAGSFGQRFLLVPAFGADGMSVGACVTQHSVRKHPLHMRQIFAADIRLGRWVRDDATGEWLVLTRSDVDNITRLMWIGSLKSTSRERITITCLSDVFDTGDIARSVLFQCVDTEYRPCPLCGSPPGVCGGCTLPVLRPSHPLDHFTSSANLMAVGGGHWSGQVKVTVYGQEGLKPMLPSSTPFAHRCKYNQDEQLALSLQGLAISERMQMSTPIPLPSPVSADMRELQQLASMYPDMLCTSGAGSSGSANANGSGSAGPGSSSGGDGGSSGITIPACTFDQLASSFLNPDFSGHVFPVAPAGLPALPGIPLPNLDITPAAEENDSSSNLALHDLTGMSGMVYHQPDHSSDAFAATTAAAAAFAAANAVPVVGHFSGANVRQHNKSLFPQQKLQLTDKERRQEERRVKNRIAAAKSNARAREALEKMRTDIEDNHASIITLTKRKENLEAENTAMRSQLGLHVPVNTG